jgi:GNAT superfamily N-acetyltransferase
MDPDALPPLSEPLTLTLRDSTRLTVRPVGPGDASRIAGMFERLSERSRYQRFMTAVNELGESQLRYLTEIDHRDHEALIAIDPEGGEGVGVARYVRTASDPAAAEAAVTVIDDWQGRGVGSALCNLLAARAREEDIARFTALLLTDNDQMREVLATLGPARVVSRDAGTVDVEVDIPERGIGDHMAGVLRVVAGGAVELATPPWGLRVNPDR